MNAEINIPLDPQPATSAGPADQAGVPNVAFDEVNGNWDEVRVQLDSRMRGGIDGDALQRAIEANSVSAQVAMFGGAVQLDAASANRSLVSRATRGGSSAQAFWWGFHIVVSHEDVVAIVNAFDGLDQFINAISAVVPGVIRPFLGVVKIFLEISSAVLRAVDRGRGVYISMSWFAPGIFVPTSV